MCFDIQKNNHEYVSSRHEVVEDIFEKRREVEATYNSEETSNVPTKFLTPSSIHTLQIYNI